ncbi:MAG: FtsX-like permease family protein [Gemmatimonadota bacterium]|nr:MAG: FtsX-like permease family protein [Gemmatimonadota bacterium]
MKYARLIWVNLTRNKRRTILTALSVAAALFLFVALRSVNTTLDDARQVGSESRMMVRNAISVVFPLPEAYHSWISTVPGVRRVTWGNWFHGIYQDRRDFFPSFAVDVDGYFDIYPEMVVPEDQEQAFRRERTAALVGTGLMERFGWRLGQTISLTSLIYSPDQAWPFTIRAVYTPLPGWTDEAFYFHYDYLYEMSEWTQPGWYILELEDPSLAATIAATIDEHYENSRYATRTETERAYLAGIASMYGNVGLLINAVGIAVFFAILLVAANTMMMAARERASEVAVLKTLGFSDRLLFGLVLAEAAAITAIGGLLGVVGAKLLFEGTGFQGMGLLPGFEVKLRTATLGVSIAIVLGLISGLLPAWQAARLPVARTLRRVA